MKGKHVLGLVLVLGLLITAGSAMAWGPGSWGGPGWGRGGACWRASGPGGYGPAWDEDTAKLRDELFKKHGELRELMAADKIDEGKVQALHAEIVKLRNQLSEKRFSTMMDYRKNNPDARFGYGPGYGQGYGRRGAWGPGSCWR